MRRVRYIVATSLDGYIAGSDGGADWIAHEPSYDFRALFAQFDTFLIGRRTYETMSGAGRGSTPGVKSFVFSKTLRQEDHPGVTLVAGSAKPLIDALRAEAGKDIWLFGGGELFRSLLEEGLVDTVEVAISPVLLGGGIPMLPPPGGRAKLELTGHHVYGSGMIAIQYAVKAEPPK
jgi:dihydrofolate reductase